MIDQVGSVRANIGPQRVGHAMSGSRPYRPLVFVDIDTQRDFLEQGRPLFIAGSEAILPNLDRLTSFARERRIPVIATACAHTPESPELTVFPPHCLVGTEGQERVAATAWPGGRTLRPGETLDSDADLPGHLTLEKDAYDVFSRPDAISIFERYAEGRPTFVVYGVASDYCVRCAVEGLVASGYPTVLVVDAIRPVVPEDEPELLTRFAHAGVELMLTEAVLSL
jgi:nicotinamidase/pyrazinamidase